MGWAQRGEVISIGSDACIPANALLVSCYFFTIKEVVVAAGLGMEVGVSEAHPPHHGPLWVGCRLRGSGNRRFIVKKFCGSGDNRKKNEVRRPLCYLTAVLLGRWWASSLGLAVG